MTNEADSLVTAARPRRVTSSHFAMATLALVLIFGAYSRLARLGDASLWNDELLHVFSAESMERGNGPRLPSGEIYTRGIDLTRLVRVSRSYVADPEASGRLPSAMFGVAGLVILAAAAWRIAGPWPAVWATLLLAVFPVSLQEARNTRFYTQQLVHGLVALYAGWRALERKPFAGGQASDDDVRPGDRWFWVGLTVVAFATAARIQPTTISVAAGWGAAVLAFAAIDVTRFGARAIRVSVPVQLVALGIAGMLIVLVARPGLLRTAMTMAMEVPLWAQGSFSPRAYYWMLSAAAPVMLSLLPLIFLVVARRNWALALYLVAWTAVPLALHSFVFRFQADRYVLLALPAMFIAAGIAATDGSTALRRAVTDGVRGFHPRYGPRLAGLVALGTVVLVAVTMVVTTPAFVYTRKVAAGLADVRPEPDWRRALEVLRSTPGADSLPVGSLQALAAKFYWKRIDFTIERGLLQRPVGGPDTPGLRVLQIFPEGIADFYSGVPVLWTPQGVRQHFGTGRDVIVVIDSTAETPEPGSIMEALQHGAGDELCLGRCGTIHLHRLTLTPATNGDTR